MKTGKGRELNHRGIHVQLVEVQFFSSDTCSFCPVAFEYINRTLSDLKIPNVVKVINLSDPANATLAEKLDVRSVPTTIISGNRLVGVPLEEDLKTFLYTALTQIKNMERANPTFLAAIDPSLKALREFQQPISFFCFGLDHAGKTTILRKIQHESWETQPTTAVAFERIFLNDFSVSVWDAGGQKNVRPLWAKYIRNPSALVFVLESSAPDRFAEAKEEFWKVIGHPEVTSQPVLVLAHKKDLLDKKINPKEIEEYFNLPMLRQPCRVFLTTIYDDVSITKAFSWVLDQVLAKQVIRELPKRMTVTKK